MGSHPVKSAKLGLTGARRWHKRQAHGLASVRLHGSLAVPGPASSLPSSSPPSSRVRHGSVKTVLGLTLTVVRKQEPATATTPTEREPTSKTRPPSNAPSIKATDKRRVPVLASESTIPSRAHRARPTLSAELPCPPSNGRPRQAPAPRPRPPPALPSAGSRPVLPPAGPPTPDPHLRPRLWSLASGCPRSRPYAEEGRNKVTVSLSDREGPLGREQAGDRLLPSTTSIRLASLGVPSSTDPRTRQPQARHLPPEGAFPASAKGSLLRTGPLPDLTTLHPSPTLGTSSTTYPSRLPTPPGLKTPIRRVRCTQRRLRPTRLRFPP